MQATMNMTNVQHDNNISFSNNNNFYNSSLSNNNRKQTTSNNNRSFNTFNEKNYYTKRYLKNINSLNSTLNKTSQTSLEGNQTKKFSNFYESTNTNFGNTSQSIISVPNIFLIRDIKSVETFKTEKRNRYFKEKQLLSQAQQLNINNNPVKNHRKFEEFNKTKYHAINKLVALNVQPENSLNIHYNRSYYNHDELKDKKNLVINDMLTTDVEENKFNENSAVIMFDEDDKDHMNKEKTENINRDFGMNSSKEKEKEKEKEKKKKEDNKINNTNVRSVTKHLQDFNKFDIEFNETLKIHHYTNPNLIENIKKNVSKLLDRINSNYDIEKYSKSDTKTLFNKNCDVMLTPISYYNMHNESESSKFKTTLQNKISSLSTINESKEKVLDMFNRTTVHKDLEGKVVEIDYSKIKQHNIPVINEGYISDMTARNKFLYDKYKPTIYYNEFCSPTYSEFTKQKGELFRKHRRSFLKDLRKPKEMSDNIEFDKQSLINKFDLTDIKDLALPKHENIWDNFFKSRDEEIRKIEKDWKINHSEVSSQRSNYLGGSVNNSTHNIKNNAPKETNNIPPQQNNNIKSSNNLSQGNNSKTKFMDKASKNQSRKNNIKV